MSTVSEDNVTLTRLLRRVARDYPATLPDYLAAWWEDEQKTVIMEDTRAADRKAASRVELEAKIADLQLKLSQLQ